MNSEIGTVFGWKENIISRCVRHGKLFFSTPHSCWVLFSFFLFFSFSLVFFPTFPLRSFNKGKPTSFSSSKWNTKSTLQDMNKSIEWNTTHAKAPKTFAQKFKRIENYTCTHPVCQWNWLINTVRYRFNVSLQKRLFSFFGRFHFHSATRNNKID